MRFHLGKKVHVAPKKGPPFLDPRARNRWNLWFQFQHPSLIRLAKELLHSKGLWPHPVPLNRLVPVVRLYLYAKVGLL